MWRTKMLGLAVVSGLVLGACYGSQEIRERSELVEDPRTAEMKRLWTALEDTVGESGYVVELNRPQDKILTTKWVEHGPEVRRRVRMTLVVTNVGLGMNATVQYERKQGELWVPVKGEPRLTRAAKQEEQLLIRRAYERWTGESLD